MAGPVDGLLPIEREVIAILGDQVRQESRSHQAAFQERLRQRGDDGHRVQEAALHILRPHRAPPQEVFRFLIEPLADFLANAAPILRRRLDGLGHDDFFNHRQVLGQPWRSFTRRRWDRRAPWGLRGHGLGSLSRLVQAL